jgi:hypothetical protein
LKELLKRSDVTSLKAQHQLHISIITWDYGLSLFH